MAKLTREELTEYYHLLDINMDAWYDLTPEQVVRFRELDQRFQEEEDRRRDYADDRYEDFRDMGDDED